MCHDFILYNFVNSSNTLFNPQHSSLYKINQLFCQQTFSQTDLKTGNKVFNLKLLRRLNMKKGNI